MHVPRPFPCEGQGTRGASIDRLRSRLTRSGNETMGPKDLGTRLAKSCTVSQLLQCIVYNTNFHKILLLYS